MASKTYYLDTLREEEKPTRMTAKTGLPAPDSDFLPDCRECTLDWTSLIDEAESEPLIISLSEARLDQVKRMALNLVWYDELGVGRVIQACGWLIVRLVDQLGANQAGSIIYSTARRINSLEKTRSRKVRFRIDSNLATFLRQLATSWGWIEGTSDEKLQLIIDYCCYAGWRLSNHLGEGFEQTLEEAVRELYHSFNNSQREVTMLLEHIRQD